MKQSSLAKSIALIVGSLVGSQLVYANPNGAQVVQGTATFSNPSANVLNINNSRNAIINWQKFNIGAGQTTNFIQPSSTSSVLNRVISNNPSQILGNLNSNGRVFLINQQGILVGEGANINTAGFFGSTLNITDNDFLNGKLNFAGGGQGDFENQGYIHAGEDGSIVLIAPNIENGGVIEVENGNVILAAGKSISITSLENSSIQFEVTSAENQVTNLGKIIAKNGAASIFAGTLKHSGSIRASGLVQNADGSISLVATDKVEVSGNVDVSGEQGGYIEVLGEQVEINDGATVNASGTSGGGEILIGGDQQGLNPDIKNATSTTISKNAEVHADATDSGDGGKVIVFAKNDVHVHGDVTAKGGEISGDGGFIETSGLQQLDITSVPDASAANGKAGEWLIDPNNITLVSGTGFNIIGDPDFTTSGDNAQLDVALIEAALLAGNDVTVSTGTSGTNSEDGDIFIYSSITTTHTGNASLTFNAHDQIFIDTQSGGPISIVSTVGSLDLTLNADSDGIGGGDITFFTGSGQSFPITIDTNGGIFKTNTDVNISGDVFNPSSVVNVLNSEWIIPQANSLIVNEDLTLNLTGNTFHNHGHIDIQDSSANLDLSGDLLDIAVGGSLIGSGTLIGDVEVNGGILAGGDAYTFFGQLSIIGALTVNSGLYYSVIDPVEGLLASTVSADTISINGGDLMVVWDNSYSPLLVTNGDSVGMMYCTTGTGCLTGAGFNTVVNPITVNLGEVDLNITSPETLTYKLTTLDPSPNIISWVSSVPGSWNDPVNWSVDSVTGVASVPTAADYVFIENDFGPAIVDVSTLENFKGLQSEGLITISAGGNLAMGGDAFILDSSSGGNYGLTIAGAGATVSGSGVMYVAGTDLILDEGRLQTDVVNWGLTVVSNAAANFQLDSNFVNNTFFLVADNSGVNSLTGAGSIYNNAFWDVLADFDTTVLIDNRASGVISLPVPGYSMTLGGNSILDGIINSSAGSPFILTAGTHNLSASLVQSGELVLDGGTFQGLLNLDVASSLDIRAADSNVIFDGFLVDSFGSVTVSNSINTFSLNNSADWFVQGAFSQLAGSSIEINSSSFMTFDTGSDLSGSSGGILLVNGGSLDVTTNVTGPFDFDTAGIALLVSSGGSLLFDQDVNLGNLALDGSVTNNASLSINNFVWDGGILDGSGFTSINQSDLTGLASMSLDNHDLTLTGTTNWTSTTNELTLNNAQIINDGIFNDSSSVLITGIGGTVSFINNASYVVNSAAFSGIDIDFQNYGSVDVQSGTFTLFGGGSSSAASFNIDSFIQFGGIHTLQDVVFSGNGEFVQTSGSTQMDSTGSAVFGLDTLVSAGSLTLNHDATLPGLSITSGVLTNTANLLVSNLLWNGGTLQGAGTTTISSQADLTGAAGMTLDTQTLTLQNVANWSSTSGDLTVSNATINNQGVFTDSSTRSILGTGTFNNSGSYVLNSAGTSGMGILFNNNAGNIDLQSGTFDLAGNTLTLGGGVLSGNGTLIANVIADSVSVIAPGDSIGSIGLLNISGDLTFDAGSGYELEMDFGTADRIITTGAVSIDSAADLNIIGYNGYNGDIADSGSVLSTTSTSGISGGFTVNQHADFTVADQYISGPPDSLDIAVVGLNNFWLSSVDGAWETLSNWSRNVLPTVGHDVIIDNGSLTVTVNSLNTSDIAIQSLTTSSTTTFNLANSSALFVNGDVFAGILNLDTANFTVDGNLTAVSASVSNIGSVLNGTGQLNLSTSLALTDGTVSGWSSINVPQLNVSGSSQLVNTAYLHNGAVEITSSGDKLALSNTVMTTESTASMTGAGTLDLQTGANWVVNATPFTMPVAMTLDLNGGLLTNVERLVFPGIVNAYQIDFVENGPIVIPSFTTFNYFMADNISPGVQVVNNGNFVINSAANLNIDSQFSDVFVNNGVFNVASPTTLKLLTDLDSTSGEIILSSNAAIITEAGATLTIGTNSQSGNSVTGSGVLSINGGVMDVASSAVLADTVIMNLFSGSISNAQNLTIPGIFNWTGGMIDGTGIGFTTDGLVNLLAGSLNSDWLITANSVVDWTGASVGDLTITSATITNQGEFRMGGDSNVFTDIITQAAKSFATPFNASFINQGLLLIDAGADTVVFNLNFDNDGGQIDILSGSFQLLDSNSESNLLLDQAGESLQGSGTFIGNVINTAGFVSPGKTDPADIASETGTLNITGDYTQGAEGSMLIKLDSTQYDSLNVGGLLTADGSVEFKVVNGADPAQVASLISSLGSSFSPISFATFSGDFANKTIPGELNFTLGAGGLITVTSTTTRTDAVILASNDAANQLEVLFSKDDLDFDEMVRVMHFVDQRARVSLEEEDEDEEKIAPRLVCK